MIRNAILTSVALCVPAIASAQDISDSDTDNIIVVTGERTERTLQETASSVSVTTQADLDAFAGPDTLERIFNQTANVTTSGNGNQGPTIRGANTSGILTSLESFFGGSQPRTTIQVDGRQLTFNEFVYSGESAWDIERVEIFRGPQTTTQGRNAIAGAIFIETAKPNHDEFEGKLRAIVGNFDTYQASAVVSGPIADGQLAFRLSADYREQESFVRPLGVTADLGRNLRRIETLNLRGKLSIKPEALPGFDGLITVTHADTSRPQTEGIDAPFEDLQRFNPGFSIFETNSDAITVALNYAVSDNFGLSNTTSYSDVSVQRLVAPGQGNADIQSDELTNELLARFGNEGSAITGLAGFYISRFESEETLDLSGFGIGIGDFNDERDSLGIFAEANIALSPDLYANIGGRWQRDSQTRLGGFAGVIPIDFDESFDAFLPKFELAFDVSDEVRIGLIAERGFNAGGFTFNFETFSAETFEQETLWNYEAFFRAQLLDQRLTLNGNIFYSDIDDLQIATLVELGPDFFANIFSNAPEARSIGAELEARFAVNDRWTLQTGIGITDTKFQSDSNAGALIDGNEFQRTPGLTAVGGIIWEPAPGFTLSGFGRYSDGYFSDDANLAANNVDSYFVADFQASYEYEGLRLFLDLTNAFDAFYELSVFDSGTLANVGEPRKVSVGLEFAF
ncbi:TonB-dependent receptor [Parasphingorhabdus cellanae]|uniref:TonB-dependent receptor n=1 Tax=Parasphingorhabdus cellanae TaxID=2806553 RepID=A0ABX7T5S0_9SPHN|nr:TonB-dependent receptor [Parasphingorhabdus cellanae]QTD56881.1 TonB-dependent receptor [Parasphingorhabdus cellanae]